MSVKERQLAALCRDMVDEFYRIWFYTQQGSHAASDTRKAHRRYRLRLDRLTKRKGKK